MSLDKLLGRASEEATSDASRVIFEGAEGISDAGDRLRKSDLGRALSDVDNGGGGSGSRLSDGSNTGYTGKEVKRGVKGALRDLEDVADDVGGR